MADLSTISSMATAGGTLILAVATFASIRSANRSARVAEKSMLASQRPILIPSREEDPDERVRFVDDVIFHLPGHGGIAKIKGGQLYLAMAIRNGGSGLAVIHGWRIEPDYEQRAERPADLDEFRRQSRDLYIPAGSTGFWQGAIRDAEDPAYAAVQELADRRERVLVDLLYGDYEGGQRTIARFAVPTVKDDQDGAKADVLRYWNVDGDGPR